MKTSCLFYREVVQTVVLSWSVICHCARDERPRGSAHRIFHRDGTDVSQEKSRGRVGIPC